MGGVCANANTGVGTESKVAAGLETGVNMVVGMDTKSAADMSGNVVVAGTGSAMASVGADVGVGMGLMVIEVQLGMIVGSIASVCVAASKCSVHNSRGRRSEWVVEVEIYVGTGTVPSVCAAASECSGLAGVQHRTVMVEPDAVVGLETDVVVVVVVVVVDVQTGMGPKIIGAQKWKLRLWQWGAWKPVWWLQV